MKARHTTAKTVSHARETHDEAGDARDQIIDWLRDAYAMERGLESALKKQADNEDLSQDIRTRVAAHLTETRRHAEEVKSALQSLGTDTSALKTGLGVTTQASKGMATKFAKDEEIKDLLDSYAMEHFEIASYTALAAAAQRAGLPQIAEVCRRIIPDEERMAQAIRDLLPSEVVAHIFKETEASASHHA